MPSSLNYYLGNGDVTKGECIVEGAGSRAIGLMAYLGGPPLYHNGHVKPNSPRSQGFDSGFRGDLGELAGKHHGWFSDGIRFLSPLTMPSLVVFPYQAPYIIGLGDRGLMLIMLTAISSSCAGRTRSGQPNGVQVHPVRGGQAKRRLSVGAQKLQFKSAKQWYNQPYTTSEDQNLENINKQAAQEQNIIVYSDEASMTNGSNEESTR